MDDPNTITPDNVIAFWPYYSQERDYSQERENGDLPICATQAAAVPFLKRQGAARPCQLASDVPRSVSMRSRCAMGRVISNRRRRKLMVAVIGLEPHELHDHAMLLLVARLGLRAQEVIAMRLDVVD